MAIQIIDNFKVNAAKPIDVRMLAETINDLDLIENPYNGLYVFVKSNNSLYYYIDGVWNVLTAPLDWSNIDNEVFFANNVNFSNDVIFDQQSVVFFNSEFNVDSQIKQNGNPSYIPIVFDSNDLIDTDFLSGKIGQLVYVIDENRYYKMTDEGLALLIPSAANYAYFPIFTSQEEAIINNAGQFPIIGIKENDSIYFCTLNNEGFFNTQPVKELQINNSLIVRVPSSDDDPPFISLNHGDKEFQLSMNDYSGEEDFPAKANLEINAEPILTSSKGIRIFNTQQDLDLYEIAKTGIISDGEIVYVKDINKFKVYDINSSYVSKYWSLIVTDLSFVDNSTTDVFTLTCEDEYLYFNNTKLLMHDTDVSVNSLRIANGVGFYGNEIAEQQGVSEIPLESITPTGYEGVDNNQTSQIYAQHSNLEDLAAYCQTLRDRIANLEQALVQSTLLTAR